VDHADRDALYEIFLHGGAAAQPRWYDKSISLICTPSGEAAVNFEHSPFDGSTIIRMMNDVWHDAAGRSSGKQLPARADESAGIVPIVPQPLEFTLPAAVALSARQASSDFEQLKAVIAVHALHFRHFGVREVRGWGLNPDGVLHMAFQLAYYRLHGRTDISIYAAASTKAYLHGRTEAVRCMSTESAAFVTGFAVDADGDMSRRMSSREQLRVAVTKHRERSREAGRGNGVDRHLFALSSLRDEQQQQQQQQQQQHGIDDDSVAAIMFGDAWAKHQKSILSTSNCSVFGPSVVTPGFGAVCDEGYGAAYVIADDSIDMCITNFTGDPGTGGAGFGGVVQAVQEEKVWDTDSEQFASEIETALLDIRALVLGTDSAL
jgi:carnitine O-acetyltransferase